MDTLRSTSASVKGPSDALVALVERPPNPLGSEVRSLRLPDQTPRGPCSARDGISRALGESDRYQGSRRQPKTRTGPVAGTAPGFARARRRSGACNGRVTLPTKQREAAFHGQWCTRRESNPPPTGSPTSFTVNGTPSLPIFGQHDEPFPRCTRRSRALRLRVVQRTA